MLKGIGNVKGKEKEIKITHIGKEDLQLFLFTDDMTVCWKSKRFDQNIPGTNKQF